jgi:hypothetical protein
MADTDTQVETDKPAYIAERHRNPAALMAQAPRANNTWAGVCAILATLVFVAILVVLYMDWTALQAA